MRLFLKMLLHEILTALASVCSTHITVCWV